MIKKREKYVNLKKLHSFSLAFRLRLHRHYHSLNIIYSRLIRNLNGRCLNLNLLISMAPGNCLENWNLNHHHKKKNTVYFYLKLLIIVSYVRLYWYFSQTLFFLSNGGQIMDDFLTCIFAIKQNHIHNLNTINAR